MNIMNIFSIILLEPLANGLVIFYRILGQNLGLAIIVFSVFLRFLLNPLTKPYIESMKKIQELTPQINKLKKKYGSDKTKLAQAQGDLYKQKGVNPTSGCLPYVLQIIVLIAMYQVFSSTLTGDNPTANFNKLLYPQLKIASGEILRTSFLYLDIAKPDVIKVNGLPFALPGLILILAAITQVLSAKMMTPFVEAENKVAKKTESKEDDLQVAMQQSSLITFPLFTLFFGMSFPSGLALYWLVFSVFQIIQQYMTSGWGGLTPWIKRLGLIQSGSKHEHK